MATEEARRARLHREASEAMSSDSADLLLGNFPPVGDRLATKSDLDVLAQLLEHKIDGDVAELRFEMAELRGEVRAQVAGLRSELKDDLRRLQGSMITTVLAVNGATVAVVFGLVKLL